ncbi:MAG: flippase [Coprobacillus cateniformis]|nr:flippase [Coprobacillus cateniformis]
MLIIPLITTPYISRVMGAENIGIYSYAYSIAAYFAMFILLGLNNYGNRTIAGVRDDKLRLSRTFSNIYAMQLLMGVIIIAVYILYVIFFAGDKIMSLIMLIYLISVMLDINWFYFGLEEFKFTVTRNTVVKIINTVLLFIFVKSSDDIYIYALLLVSGMIISQLILWILIRKYIVFVKPSISDVLLHLKPNIILFIPVIAISIYNTMDKIMLGMMSNMLEVGYYESSFKLTTIPVMAITSLGTVMLPRMSNLIANGNHEVARKYIQKSLIVSLFLSAPISLGLSAIVNEFVPLFYGDGYDACKMIIPVLVIASMFIAWANVIRTQYLIPNKKDKIYIVSVFLGAFVNVAINLLLIPRYQALGAAVGTLFAEISVCLYQTYKVRKEIKVIKYLAQAFPFVIFAIVMYFILILIPDIYSSIIMLVIKISIGGFLYMFFSLLYYKLILKRVFN